MSDEDDEEYEDENNNNLIETSKDLNNDRNYYGTSYSNRRPKPRNPTNTISEKSKGFWNYDKGMFP